MNIGEAIKKARKNRKLTQKELGLKLDKSVRMLQKYEKGEVVPSFDILKQISSILNVPMEQFLTTEGIELRKENAGLEALKTILECVYEEVEIDWHKTVNRDNEPEYDGDYEVFLKKGQEKLTLTKQSYETLFEFVRTNIPNYIKIIVSRDN